MHYLFHEHDGSFTVSDWYNEGQSISSNRAFKKAVKIPYLFKQKNTRNSFFYYDDECYGSFSTLMLSLIMLENFPEHGHYYLLGMTLYNNEINEIQKFVKEFY